MDLATRATLPDRSFAMDAPVSFGARGTIGSGCHCEDIRRRLIGDLNPVIEGYRKGSRTDAAGTVPFLEAIGTKARRSRSSLASTIKAP